MNRVRVLSAFFVFAIALASLQWSVTTVASAQTSSARQMVVIVADGAAVNWYSEGPDLARSFVGLVSTLQDEQLLVFIGVDDPSDIFGPFEAKDSDLKVIAEQIDARLTSQGPPQADGLANAVTEAYAVLGEERAAPGSSVYVITGTSPGAHFSQASSQLTVLADRFVDMGWPVNGVSLPGASDEALEFLNGLSANSGGQTFQLSVSEGYRKIVEAILSQGAKGSLAQVGSGVLTPSELMTSVISVAPGTRETTLIFFKESPYGSLRLSNPSGFEVSAGDRTASQVMETPHVVVWKLIDPAPGNWRVDARGMEGLISAWENSSNKYGVVLRSTAPLPLNDTNTLVAHVSDGDRPAVLSGVRLVANITTPTGATTVHEMKDDGNDTDSVAGDGYFSVVLPPLLVEGEYNVELELSWLEYNHRISSNASFEARAFPTMEVETLAVKELEPGERVQVAKVSVHVQGGPFPVDADRLIATLASPDGQEAILELEPRRLFGDGPAWQYDVFFTPQDQSRHTLLFQLNMEYAGRPYSQISDSIVLSSFLPPPPIAQVLKPDTPAPRAPVDARPAARPMPLPAPPEPSRALWPLLALAVLLLAGVAAAAFYLLPRTRPHGYIYNDLDEPLVDFSELKRNPVLGFLLKGWVRGRELSVPGLENVAFQFSRGRITLHGAKGQQTIRVNNQPLVEKATIQDKTWIGTGGRLYTFLLSPTAMHGGAGAD